MVKDSSRETAIKKKRKSTAGGDIDGDVYKRAIDFEEKEALSRRNDIDAKIYFDTCKEIRKLLNEISELKLHTTSDAQNKIAEKSTEVCLKIVLLKKLNRMEKVRSVFPKEQLAAEKQKVDSINLQYQNLLYEANHLKSEYRKCFQFKSKDESIELVPVREFLAEAPQNLTENFKTLNQGDESQKHELRLARLEWELQQRIQLAQLCKKLEEEKKTLETDITERKNKLEKLGPLLATVLEATKPVQEHLGLHIDKIQAEHKLAALLPNPLYLFYVNTDAYRQVNDSSMVVEIVGDQDEATLYREQEESNLGNVDDDDSEPEPEMQESEEIVEPKKRRHRKTIQVDPLEEKKKKLLFVHPLAISVTIKAKDGPSISIKFSYLTKLNLITVISSVQIPEKMTGSSSREVLSNEIVLMELVEGDMGAESPNPCTAFQLKKVGLGSFRSLVPDLGCAYGWAQKVCGMDFLAQKTGVKVDAEQLSQTMVEFVMKTVKKRLKARFALAEQLQSLERNAVPSLPEAVELPRSSVAKLTKWKGCSYQDFCQAKVNEALVANEVANDNDCFYLAFITRGNAVLQAYIVIKNDYPVNAPIFSILIDYNSEKMSSASDDNIRDMERCINVDWKYDGSNAHWLLSVQINALCIAFDVYLETEDPKNFNQTTMFIKAACGRNRRKPLKFHSNGGVGIFTQ